MKPYKELHVLDLSYYLQQGVRTTNTFCPRCKRANNVYHVMPWDYRKICTKCEVTWMEDNY